MPGAGGWQDAGRLSQNNAVTRCSCGAWVIARGSEVHPACVHLGDVTDERFEPHHRLPPPPPRGG